MSANPNGDSARREPPPKRPKNISRCPRCGKWCAQKPSGFGDNATKKCQNCRATYFASEVQAQEQIDHERWSRLRTDDASRRSSRTVDVDRLRSTRTTRRV